MFVIGWVMLSIDSASISKALDFFWPHLFRTTCAPKTKHKTWCLTMWTTLCQNGE
jgi:hypothetical protein